jgi:DNA-binding CsgD family transcriptional regulator
MEHWSLDLPTLVPWRTDAARVYLRLGDRRLARDLAREQLRRVGPDVPRTRGITLRVLGSAVDDLDDRIGLLDESVNLQYRAGDWLELARSLASLGRAQRSRGQAHEGRHTLRTAERLAERCGAELLRANLAAEHHESRSHPVTEGRDGRAAALSDSEQRVAALALLGRTNREIATDLHVTVSTIEQHLTRIYRKLHITGRSGLPDRLAARS